MDSETYVTTYTSRGEIKAVTNPDQLDTEYTYTGVAGRRKTIVDPDDGVTTYLYDAAGRQNRIIDPRDKTTTLSFDRANREISREYPNGITTTCEYDDAGNKEVVHTVREDDDFTVSRLTYTYDPVNCRTQRLDQEGVQTNWSYDRDFQLENERATGLSGYNTTYVYDAVGNRIGKEEEGQYTELVYDAANQLMRESGPEGITSYSYDAAGNQTRKEASDGDTFFDFDAASQITLAEPPTGPVEMSYNAMYQRVRKVSASGEVIKFVYDGKRLLSETDDGDVTTKSFTSGTAGAGGEYGGLIGEFDQSDLSESYPSLDAQSFATELLDEHGNVEDRLRRTAFGLALAEPAVALAISAPQPDLGSSSGSNNNGGYQQAGFTMHTGLYFDEETGLYWRESCEGGEYIDPELGRFVQKTGDENPYAYEGNNPVNETDQDANPQDEGPDDPEKTQPLVLQTPLAAGLNCADCHPDPEPERLTLLDSFETSAARQKNRATAQEQERAKIQRLRQQQRDLQAGAYGRQLLETREEYEQRLSMSQFESLMGPQPTRQERRRRYLARKHGKKFARAGSPESESERLSYIRAAIQSFIPTGDPVVAKDPNASEGFGMSSPDESLRGWIIWYANTVAKNVASAEKKKVKLSRAVFREIIRPGETEVEYQVGFVVERYVKRSNINTNQKIEVWEETEVRWTGVVAPTVESAKEDELVKAEIALYGLLTLASLHSEANEEGAYAGLSAAEGLYDGLLDLATFKVGRVLGLGPASRDLFLDGSITPESIAAAALGNIDKFSKMKALTNKKFLSPKANKEALKRMADSARGPKGIPGALGSFNGLPPLSEGPMFPLKPKSTARKSKKGCHPRKNDAFKPKVGNTKQTSQTKPNSVKSEASPKPEIVAPKSADLTKLSDDVITARIVRGDAKGRSFGTPRNPRAPTLEEFNPRIHEVKAGDLSSSITGRKHGLFPEQQQAIAKLSNEELLKFRLGDPMSATGGSGALSITGGHHRMAEIASRVASGKLPSDTIVRILLHD